MAYQRKQPENNKTGRSGGRNPESSDLRSKRSTGGDKTGRDSMRGTTSDRHFEPDAGKSYGRTSGPRTGPGSERPLSRGAGTRSGPGSERPFSRGAGTRTGPGSGKSVGRDLDRRTGSSGGRTFGQGAPRRFEPVARAVDAVSKDAETDEVRPDDRLEGRNPVLEALRAGRTINKIWVAAADGSRLDPTIGRIIAMARERGIPLVEVPRTAMDKMSSTRLHQGVIAQIASHEYVEFDELVDRVTQKKADPFFMMLDSLKDAYNLGSILRIADAAGVDGIIIPRHRSIGLDATVAKASSGAIEYVPVARVTNLVRTIEDLKKKGFWIFGTDASAEITYDRAKFEGPILLIIGSEGEGVHSNVLEKCDVTVSVPMDGNVNSLNAAIAAGIIVFEARRQRRNKEKS